MIRAGAAGIHIEDQATAKRCGHRPNKELVSADEMCDRLKAACDGRTDASFVLMARTDAAANEGVDAAIARACRYRDAGADMIFAEALGTLEEYRRFVDAVNVPVLANITEFGKTPMFTVDELGSAGVRLVLYPLSAFRAMNAAALEVYRTIRRDGTQAAILPKMQTRGGTLRVFELPRLRGPTQCIAVKGSPLMKNVYAITVSLLSLLPCTMLLGPVCQAAVTDTSKPANYDEIKALLDSYASAIDNYGEPQDGRMALLAKGDEETLALIELLKEKISAPSFPQEKSDIVSILAHNKATDKKLSANCWRKYCRRRSKNGMDNGGSWRRLDS